MKIAVTGPGGQLGSELVRQGCIPLNGRLFSWDLTNEAIELNPDIIINCAAHTKVDDCESAIDESYCTNVKGVKYLSAVSTPNRLVQISTDYIFDGKFGPYYYNDPPNPISVYGWSKLGGELVARQHKGPWLIIRTTVLFSEAKNNFVYKIVKQLEQGGKVTLYQPNLLGTPTHVPELAKEIIRVVKAGYAGIAHIAGKDAITRLEFARLIAIAFDFDPDDIIGTDEPLPFESASRPLRGGLRCGHSEGEEIKTHDFQRGLTELAERYRQGKIWK